MSPAALNPGLPDEAYDDAVRRITDTAASHPTLPSPYYDTSAA